MGGWKRTSDPVNNNFHILINNFDQRGTFYEIDSVQREDQGKWVYFQVFERLFAHLAKKKAHQGSTNFSRLLVFTCTQSSVVKRIYLLLLMLLFGRFR